MRSYCATMCVVAAGVAIFAAGSAGFAQHVRYRIEVLNPSDPASTVCPCFFPQGMSSDGLTAGFFFGPDGTYNAFRQESNLITDISPPGANRAFARSINNAGHAVGWTDYFTPQHAFHYDGVDVNDLGTLGGTYSDAHDINDAGKIVGSASLPNDDDHAVLWYNGQAIHLGAIDNSPFSEATAINAGGFIVGWSWNADWDARPVYWTAALAGPFELPMISTALTAQANDVNDVQDIVGSALLPADQSGQSPRHAVLWTGGTAIDLGLLREAGEGMTIYGGPALDSTSAAAINNDGIIVGNSSFPAAEPVVRFGPFVWRDNDMRNLNDLMIADGSDWIITETAGISDAGVIAASARPTGSNHSRAVLLVPATNVLEDLDGSGAVDVFDLFALLDAWGDCGTTCPADVNNDGGVDVFDLFALLNEWAS